MTDALDRISKARSRLVFNEPFWGCLCLQQRLVEDPHCETGWTDGRHIGYNPAYIKSLSDDQIMAFVAHESGGHVGLMHHLRMQKRESRRWNIACDFAVNLILKEAGFELGDGWLLDYRFKGMTAEAIYETSDFKELIDKNGGSDPGGSGEVREATGPDGETLTGSKLVEAELQAKSDLAQAVSLARFAGKLPLGIERIVERLLAPSVNWREALLHFSKQMQKNDYSWAKPNSRYMSQGLYMPSLYGEESCDLIVAIDTSCSVRDDELAQFAAEINSIRNEVPTRVTRLCCDTKVHYPETFEPEEGIKLPNYGGGGTDFRPPFKWVEENVDTEPDGFVYLSDGDCNSFPDDPPDYPVLWAITGERGFNPPFGEVVRVTLTKE